MDEKNITTSLFDPFTQVQKVLPFLFENSVHLSIIVNDNLIVHVWFRRAELELNKSDSGFIYSRRSTCGRNDYLVQGDSFDKLGIFDCTAYFFDDSDISEVDIRGCGGKETSDGCHSDRG